MDRRLRAAHGHDGRGTCLGRRGAGGESGARGPSSTRSCASPRCSRGSRRTASCAGGPAASSTTCRPISRPVWSSRSAGSWRARGPSIRYAGCSSSAGNRPFPTRSCLTQTSCILWQGVWRSFRSTWNGGMGRHTSSAWATAGAWTSTPWPRATSSTGRSSEARAVAWGAVGPRQRWRGPAPRRPGQHHRPDRGPAPPVRECRAAQPRGGRPRRLGNKRDGAPRVPGRRAVVRARHRPQDRVAGPAHTHRPRSSQRTRRPPTRWPRSSWSWTARKVWASSTASTGSLHCSSSRTDGYRSSRSPAAGRAHHRSRRRAPTERPSARYGPGAGSPRPVAAPARCRLPAA